MAVTINADNGVSSGSAGLKQTADSTGILALQTNGTTAVSISTGQVVTLTNALPVASGGTGATSASAARTSLGLVIGTDVLAPNGSGASLTSLNASNISSGTLATARLPTGTILQVQRNQVTGRTTGANTFPYTTSALGSPSSTTGSKYLEVSFTPILATSLILIQVYCSALSEQTNTSNAAAAGIWKNNTGAPLTVWYALNLTAAGGSPPGGVNSAGNINMMYTETSGSTTTRTYSWYAGMDSGAGLINSIGSDTSFGGQMSSIMTVMEIAA